MTAHDIAKLARALIHDFPEQYALCDQRNSRTTTSPSTTATACRLDPSVDGVKTGHTSSAGYCLVTSAKREQGRMIAVVLRGQGREGPGQCQSGAAELRLLHDAADARGRCGAGRTARLAQGYRKAAARPRRAARRHGAQGQGRGLKSEIQVDPQIEAPVGRGSVHGKVVVTLDGSTVAEAPLVALRDVAEGSFFSRPLDHILMLFHKLIG